MAGQGPQPAMPVIEVGLGKGGQREPGRLSLARVDSGAEGDEIILGRTVLNQLVVTLNGPASTVEIAA
jgi:hypothetical protein